MRWRTDETQTNQFNLQLWDFLHARGMEDSQIDGIVYNIYYVNYLQIFFDYGKTFILALIKYYEDNDYFEECAEIQATIKKHNKATGEQITLKN